MRVVLTSQPDPEVIGQIEDDLVRVAGEHVADAGEPTGDLLVDPRLGHVECGYAPVGSSAGHSGSAPPGSESAREI